jgi:hypothetical protein
MPPTAISTSWERAWISGSNSQAATTSAVPETRYHIQDSGDGPGSFLENGLDNLGVCIWTPPRLQVIGLWQLARLHTYIRPLQVAYDDAGP